MNIDFMIQKQIDDYIFQNYQPGVDEGKGPAKEELLTERTASAKSSKDLSDAQKSDLDELLNNAGESFHSMLFRLIDEKGLTDVEVYRRAGMDRKLFSKIRSNPAYHPKRTTVLVLAVALHLNLGETGDFLASAEYALSNANRGDLIIKYFISHDEYDLEKINNALAAYGEPVLQ